MSYISRSLTICSALHAGRRMLKLDMYNACKRKHVLYVYLPLPIRTYYGWTIGKA